MLTMYSFRAECMVDVTDFIKLKSDNVITPFTMDDLVWIGNRINAAIKRGDI